MHTKLNTSFLILYMSATKLYPSAPSESPKVGEEKLEKQTNSKIFKVPTYDLEEKIIYLKDENSKPIYTNYNVFFSTI